MVARNRSGPQNQTKGRFGSQDFCVLTKSGMKHVGMNSHSKYQGNDMKSYGGLYYVNKGSYHRVYKKKFVDQVQRKLQQKSKNKQRKVHSGKKKNEHNLKQRKTQNRKRSSGFNHKKSERRSKSKTCLNKHNDRPNSPLKNEYLNKMADLIRNRDVEDMNMNQLASTLKYELVYYTNKMVNQKFDADQLH